MDRFKVYFDGMCRICSREIEFYRARDGAKDIDWIDIASKKFDAKHEGVDFETIMRVFHVRDESGRLISGVDGFIEIWKRIPSLRSWVFLSKIPGARLLMHLGYKVFVRVRPYLPKKPGDCDDGYCDRRW